VRFLLDESAELRIAAALRDDGHDIATIVHDHSASLVDREVLRIANDAQRVLITNDRDFGELVFGQKMPHAGIIYFRLPLDTTADQKIRWLRRIFRDHTDALGAIHRRHPWWYPGLLAGPADYRGTALGW
jgi:predicted nuclease of predicted toxin-antitoxin system